MATSIFGLGGAVNANVNGTVVRQSFTATGGQQLFNLTNFTYSPATNSLFVTINGDVQYIVRDYSETSSSSFTLVEGCVAGDFVDVWGFPEMTLSAVTPGSVNLGGGYTLQTYINDSIINVKAYPYLAKGDSTTDDTAAINRAITALMLTGGKIFFPPGVYRVTSPIIPYRRTTLIGAGNASSNSTSLYGATTILKDFDGVAVQCGWDISGLEDLTVDSKAARTGDNIQMAGSRVFAVRVSSTNSLGNGWRLGTDAVTGLDGNPANSNCGSLKDCQALNNVLSGFWTNDPTGPTDVNAWHIDHPIASGNGVDGLVFNFADWISVTNPVCQTNGAYGIRLMANARSIDIRGGDIEGNALGQGVLEAGALSNFIIGPHLSPTVCWVDNSGFPGRNVIIQYNNTIASGKMDFGPESSLDYVGNAPTIASAATIAPVRRITFISGAAAIATITPPPLIAYLGGTIRLIPTGAFTWTAAGNIAIAGNAVIGKSLELSYDPGTNKWYPAYIA